MSHRWLALAVIPSFLLLIAGRPAARAADEEDEPTFLDKKLSDWLALLHEGKDAKARRRGVIGVEQIGHEKSRKVIPALVKALREDREPVVRAAAARAVGRSVARALEHAREGKKEEPRFDYARDALAAAVRTEKDEQVREAAALALGEMGPDAKGSVGALAAALRDKNAAVVKAAASALRRMGREAQDAQPDLQRLLGDKKADLEARTDAAVCLGLIKPDAREALPVLKEVLGDARADARLRKTVADTLGKIGREAADASDVLAEALVAKESTPELRLAAVTAIDQFGPDGKAAIPALIKAVGDEALIRQMGDSARFIRCMAMHALGRMGRELDAQRKEAVKAVLKATDEPSAEVCVTALETLGALSAEGLGGETDEVIKRLDAVLAREGRKPIREAAQAARDKIRPPKK